MKRYERYVVLEVDRLNCDNEMLFATKGDDKLCVDVIRNGFDYFFGFEYREIKNKFNRC